jgi:hypothetical protein
MSSFSVCWNRVRLEWRKHAERAPWAQEAVLCERVEPSGRCGKFLPTCGR